MKKLIFLLAICFGVFICQDVDAQIQPNERKPAVELDTNNNSTQLQLQKSEKKVLLPENSVNIVILEKKTNSSVKRSANLNLVVDPTKISQEPQIISPN